MGAIGLVDFGKLGVRKGYNLALKSFDTATLPSSFRVFVSSAGISIILPKYCNQLGRKFEDGPMAWVFFLLRGFRIELLSVIQSEIF